MRKRFTLALLSLLLVPLGMMAQSVTVDPSTGNLIAAYTGDSQDQGFRNGMSALWRHEQLPLSLAVSDYSTLDNGEIGSPTSNMCVNQTTGLLTILGGSPYDCYFVLSLPKGYRFKGYKMVVLNNLNGVTVYSTPTNSLRLGSTTKTLVEVEKGENFDGTTLATTGEMGSSNSNTEYVLERSSMTDSDMGNQLYFRIKHGTDAFYGLSIKEFTVYFTSEGTFEAEVTPTAKDVAKSLVMSPFKTNKMDIGAVQTASQGGNEFYAYTHRNVKNIDAYTYIYQSDAVQDGVPSDVASVKKIFPVTVGGNNYFAFGNGVYYAEGPTEVHSQTGLTYPVGYRVVGAKFIPQWASYTSGGTETRNYYYITYTSDNTTYYLNDQLHFTTTRFGWYYNESTGAIYTGGGANIRYLSCQGSGDTRTLSFSSNPPSTDPNNPGYYDLIVFNRNNRTYIGWDNWNSYRRYYLQGTTNASTIPTVRRDYTTSAAAWVGAGQQTVTFPAYNPGKFTLNIYDKTGKTVIATKTVNAASDAGTVIDLTDKATYGYNNDAIKFEITDLPDDCSALVDVSLFMQALNPYIDQMSIRCHDADNQLSLSQPFTANDFKVAGDAFNFYIPDTYKDKDLTFTFEDLWSQYGDNTYYTGALQKDGYARYSFVTSSYFEPINQNGNDGLYSTVYDPNASYVNKVKASKAGNIRYKFNNAENLSNTGSQTGISYLQEYPFTVANYIGSKDPDGGTEVGAMKECTLNAQTAKSDTYYLFTADETRYNIAPSKAWQHRYYAFYRMDINLETHTYDPKLEWNKIYDETCYYKDGDASDAMWGLKLNTVDHDTQAPVTGYLTVKEIDKAITAALGKDGAPTATDQILYVDGSELYSILNSNDMTLAQLKAKLSPNALFYLPEGTTSTLDNFAYKTGSTFRAGKDIVISDRKPFFAPYAIQVDGDNYATHTRNITWDTNGTVANSTLVLPFTLALDGEGNYTSPDGDCAFTLNKMNPTDALSYDYMNSDPHAAELAKSYFSPITDITVADANTPYVVKVTQAPSDGNSFIAKQKGSLIVATPTTTSGNYDASTYVFTGDTGTGSITDKEGKTASYTFTAKGSYAGKTIKKEGNNVFYFGANMFIAIQNMRASTLKVYPFRAYYDYTASGNINANMSTLSIVYGENPMTDGIDVFDAAKPIVDLNSPVYDIQGRKIGNNLNEVKGKKLGKGIYVIDGQKIIVK